MTTVLERSVSFGYTIAYVPDVSLSLRFFNEAFGLATRFLHESGAYGELDTGQTILAFAVDALGDENFPGGHVSAHSSPRPLGVEIAMVTVDVAAAHAKAIACGARELSPPVEKPWGQIVSYLRSPDGLLLELCTPIAA